MKNNETPPVHSAWGIYPVALGFLIAIGIFDYLTSWEFSDFLFYALPIFLGSWYGNRKLGVCLALLSGLTWFGANLHSTPYATSQVYLWAGVTRMAYFAFVAVGGNAIKKLKEEHLANMKAMTRTRELEREVLRASDREQMRIGQDLHDGVCQNLAAIDCALECLRTELQQRGASEAATAVTVQGLLNETMVEARGLARGICPVHLSGEGFQAALDALTKRIGQFREMAISFECEGNLEIDDYRVATHLYRIAQEALNNAARHSGAKSIKLKIVRGHGGMIMSIADDGVGMNYADLPETGMGLSTIRYRAESTGAALEIRRNRPFGKVVRCTIAISSSGHPPVSTS